MSAIEFVRSNPPSPSPVAPKEAPKLLSIPQTDRQKVDLEAQLAAKRGQRESRWDEYTAAIEMGTTLLRAGEPEDFAKALGPIARASVLVWLLRGADDALNKETEEETARAIETMLSRLSEFRNGRAEAEVMFVRARRAALLDVLGETFPLHLGPPVHCGDLVPDLVSIAANVPSSSVISLRHELLIPTHPDGRMLLYRRTRREPSKCCRAASWSMPSTFRPRGRPSGGCPRTPLGGSGQSLGLTGRSRYRSLTAVAETTRMGYAPERGGPRKALSGWCGMRWDERG